MHVLSEITGKPETVIVTGSGRSGTTALSRVCQGLGIDWLVSGGGETVEHGEVSRLVIEGSDDELSEFLALQCEPIWGFKRPGLMPILLNRHHLFERPAVLMITRDPAAAAVTHLKYREQPTMHVLRNYTQANLRNVDMAESLSQFCSVAVVSYERLLTRPEETIPELAKFLQVPFRMAALDEVRLGDERYIPKVPKCRVCGGLVSECHNCV